ncbi:hypothetical protein OPIT5_10205 [Opitutaceae bacterium TAV5]|nr:hypothetical protein OPIT5_10205 [Opitutaceae bacterium TAV5]
MIESRKQQFLAALIGNRDQTFDPVSGLLDPESCGVRESLFYALLLLEQGEHSRLGRAEAIIRRLLEDNKPACQDVWADFALFWIWSRQRRRLGRSLLRKIPAELQKITATLRLRETGGPLNRRLDPEKLLRQLLFLACAETMDPAEKNGQATLPEFVAATEFQPGDVPSLIVVSCMFDLVRNSGARQRARRLARHCWSRLVDQIEARGQHAHAPDRSSPDGFSDTIALLLEKGSCGRMQTARLPGNGASVPGEYLFALVGDIEAPPAIVGRLARIAETAHLHPGNTLTDFLLHSQPLPGPLASW